MKKYTMNIINKQGETFQTFHSDSMAELRSIYEEKYEPYSREVINNETGKNVDWFTWSYAA